MAGKVTAPAIAGRKRSIGAEPIVMVTAYDTPFARVVDSAGVDIILVGDSVANNVLGFDTTLQVSVAEMARDDPLAHQIEHFGRVIRGEAKPIVSARDGLQNLRITEAIAEAARTGNIVDTCRHDCAGRHPGP